MKKKKSYKRYLIGVVIALGLYLSFLYLINFFVSKRYIYAFKHIFDDVFAFIQHGGEIIGVLIAIFSIIIMIIIGISILIIKIREYRG